MAALGQVRETYWAGCSPARRSFVRKLRILICEMRSDKQGARAKQLGIPLSTLSNYWSGRRMPRAHTLREIYRNVQAQAPVGMPVTLAELESLRSYALSGDRDRRAAPRGGGIAAGGPAQDRRSGRYGKVREALEVLREARASGNLRHLVSMAWSASRTLSPAEFCDAVRALHATGDTDLAETLLLADSERSADDTMRLALALIGAGLNGPAECIMRASLPSGGDGQG